MAKVPDTITRWTASAFAMSDSAGLGISKPTSLKVFQSFFVSLTLPYSVIRGEEVSIIATVFNYESKCLTVGVDTGNMQFNLIDVYEGKQCPFFKRRCYYQRRGGYNNVAWFPLGLTELNTLTLLTVI